MMSKNWLGLLGLVSCFCGARCDSNRLDSPVVLRHLTEASLAHVAFSTSSIGKLHNVYHAKSNVFPYYDTSLKNSYPRFKPEYEFADVSAASLCDTDLDAGDYHYYSGNLFQGEFSSLHQDLHPGRLLRSRLVADVSANLWIGCAGVKATAHYDNVNNVYRQLVGSKRFRLLPPRAAVALKLYGRHHPYACQSRYSDILLMQRFSREELFTLQDIITDFPTEGPLSCSSCDDPDREVRSSLIEVTLNPGDVLLIPPYWFHEATALSDSSSVSYWWDASQLDIMDALYGLPLPIEDSWSSPRKTAGLFLFVRELARASLQLARATLRGRSLSLVGLLENRYSEDWGAFQELLETSSSVTQGLEVVLREVALLESDQAFADKVSDLVTGQYVSVCRRFLSEDVHEPLSDILLGWNGTSGGSKLTAEFSCGLNEEGKCSEVDSPETDRAAVMLIKLADYVEDVFLFAAHTAQEDCPFPNAVLRLLQFLQIMEGTLV